MVATEISSGTDWRRELKPMSFDGLSTLVDVDTTLSSRARSMRAGDEPIWPGDAQVIIRPWASGRRTWRAPASRVGTRRSPSWTPR